MRDLIKKRDSESLKNVMSDSEFVRIESTFLSSATLVSYGKDLNLVKF